RVANRPKPVRERPMRKGRGGIVVLGVSCTLSAVRQVREVADGRCAHPRQWPRARRLLMTAPASLVRMLAVAEVVRRRTGAVVKRIMIDVAVFGIEAVMTRVGAALPPGPERPGNARGPLEALVERPEIG